MNQTEGVATTVNELVDALSTQRSAAWAGIQFLDTVRSLIKLNEAKSVIEIGGGRAPSFTQGEVETLGLRYTSNDISARELSKAPSWVEKAQFDVQTPDPAEIDAFVDKFDLAFSNMVMEHVPNYERAYRNIFRILRPGGVSLAYHPVLFASPFVVNKLLPETISRALLTTFFPNRTDDGIPKFPAIYSGCKISDDVRKRLLAIGYRNVWQIPFYGHTYYEKFPVVAPMQRFVARKAADHNFAALAAFTYTIVQK